MPTFPSKAQPTVVHDQLSGCRVLVTGASGFIGTHLCRYLCDRGAEVHATSRSARSSNEQCLRWWQGDLGDIATARYLLYTIQPEIVFHLAGHGVGARDIELVLPTFQNCLVTTVNLLTVATEVGFRRMVFTASMEEPESGNADITPTSPYAAAKWASSAYARMFHELYRCPVVIARVFMTYGPGQPVSKLIPYVILSLLQDRAPMLTSGKRQIDWIYVNDVVEGLLAAGLAPNVEGRTIDLGSGSLKSIRTVIELLVARIRTQAKPVFGALPDRLFEQVRVANTLGCRDLIGWQAMTSLEEGLKQTIDWYQQKLSEGGI